uniref:DUF1501 domain-containing protein n=1 Tax=Desulfovibrio sp. U5L TaxID=596152 RepID=I2Q6Q5_9BACT
MRRREVLEFLAGLGLAGLFGPAGVVAARHGRGGKAREAKPAGKGGEAGKPSWRAGQQLVVVLLQGGPDGLSMAAPVSDPLYRYLRPTTGLAPDCGGPDLGRGFVFHPAMAALAPYYAKKNLAVIPACGLAGVPAVHAGAMAAFARGGAGQGKGGWLGRLSLALGGGAGQMLVASQSEAYAGAPHYNMIAPGRGPSLPGLPVEDQTLFEAEARLFSGKEPLARPFMAGREARQDLLAKLLEESRRAAAGAIPAPAFPEFAERFGRELAKRRDAALAFVAVGGFDTHSGQGGAKGYLADRLGDAAQGLANLAVGLGKAFEDTVVVALGEFGRSARENGFGGTDNGQGGTMLVLGGPVAGGLVLGDWPGLAAHRLAGGRDIAVATDWRDVAARIAVGHLGLPQARVGEIFPGFSPASAPPAVLG